MCKHPFIFNDTKQNIIICTRCGQIWDKGESYFEFRKG